MPVDQREECFVFRVVAPVGHIAGHENRSGRWLERGHGSERPVGHRVGIDPARRQPSRRAKVQVGELADQHQTFRVSVKEALSRVH